MNLPTILASLLLFLLPSACQSWPQLASSLKPSVVTIEADRISEEGEPETMTCSGFFIDSLRHYILTDAHCEGLNLRAEGTVTTVIYKDGIRDLMIIRADLISGPALSLSQTRPLVGEEVASLGTGLGFIQPMFRVARVATVGLQIDKVPGFYVEIDNNFVPGQSGGPLINHRGEVVGIVEMSGEDVGFALSAEVIEQRVGRFFVH